MSQNRETFSAERNGTIVRWPSGSERANAVTVVQGANGLGRSTGYNGNDPIESHSVSRIVMRVHFRNLILFIGGCVCGAAIAQSAGALNKAAALDPMDQSPFDIAHVLDNLGADEPAVIRRGFRALDSIHEQVTSTLLAKPRAEGDLLQFNRADYLVKFYSSTSLDYLVQHVEAMDSRIVLLDHHDALAGRQCANALRAIGMGLHDLIVSNFFRSEDEPTDLAIRIYAELLSEARSRPSLDQLELAIASMERARDWAKKKTPPDERAVRRFERLIEELRKDPRTRRSLFEE